MLAIVVHEASHCIALWIAGKRIHEITFGIGGARIATEPLSDLQSLACSLAGPAGGLLLLLAARKFPIIALCALIQSLFNLIPVFPLDGGRALYAFVNILFPAHRSRVIYSWIERGMQAMFFILCIRMLLVWKLGMLPVAMIFLIVANLMKRKISCKDGIYAVQ